MKLGVFTVLLGDQRLDEALAYLKGLGVEAVEIGCGGFPGTAHCDAVKYLKDKSLITEFQETVKKYDLIVSALSVHGNPVHPQEEIARKFHQEYEAAVQLAAELGIDTVVGFSGCPGDSEHSKYPNWVTCPWPDDFLKILEWQWTEKLIPYWQKTAEFSKKHGINKIALEMHPGFCVYNPETLLRLRAAVGDVIGANFDPSHLFWQGMDPVAAIRELKGAIYHFHAKDTKLDLYNTSKNGVLDTKHFTREDQRSWLFRTVGYGHGEETWKAICSELRLAGYDHVISIEHEDSLMTSTEGLVKAVAFLQKVMIAEPKPTGMWWA
ncbi:MAG TPA: xylose isomerase [Firmicutes bacterium]|nr:xylose isomerase [Bacillota bacterium]